MKDRFQFFKQFYLAYIYGILVLIGLFLYFAPSYSVSYYTDKNRWLYVTNGVETKARFLGYKKKTDSKTEATIYYPVLRYYNNENQKYVTSVSEYGIKDIKNREKKIRKTVTKVTYIYNNINKVTANKHFSPYKFKVFILCKCLGLALIFFCIYNILVVFFVKRHLSNREQLDFSTFRNKNRLKYTCAFIGWTLLPIIGFLAAFGFWRMINEPSNYIKHLENFKKRAVFTQAIVVGSIPVGRYSVFNRYAFLRFKAGPGWVTAQSDFPMDNCYYKRGRKYKLYYLKSNPKIIRQKWTIEYVQPYRGHFYVLGAILLISIFLLRSLIRNYYKYKRMNWDDSDYD